MSSADKIRERFEASRRSAQAQQKLRELVERRQWRDAARVASALGLSLPTGQVVEANFARPRA